jgi:hypothetical protein
VASRAVRDEWLSSVRARAGDAQIARRAVPSAVAGLAAAILVLRMAWDAGGYFPPAYLSAGAIALGVCGVILLVTFPRFALSTEALVAVAALSLLTLWTGLSSLWSSAPSAAVEAMQRDLAYVGLLGLALIAAGSGRYARQLVWGVLAVITIICGAALLARLFPDIIREPRNAFDAYRLSYPLTYWNALGALAAIGSVLSFGLAADPRTHWVLRATAGALAVLLVTTMYLSLSRGAWMALFAGLAVLAALGAHRGSLLLTGGIVGVGCAAALGRLSAYAALTDNPHAGSGQQAAGHAYGAQLLVICALVAGALGFVAIARSSPYVMQRLDRAFRPVLMGAGAALALILVVGYAARAADTEGFVASQMISAQHWVDRQWDDFMATSAPPVAGSGRVTSGATGTRSELYRVALDNFGDHPLLGGGAGSFRIRWIADRTIGENVVNAHSLGIETLSELGIVGVILLALFIGAIVAAAVRARIRPGGLPRAQGAAVAGACAVWVVHSAVDWDWQVTALTAIAIVLAATLFPYGRVRVRRTQTDQVQPRPRD